MFYDLGSKKIKNAGENWAATNTSIIGDVTLEKNTSIWFNVTSPIIDALGATQFSPIFFTFLFPKS